MVGGADEAIDRNVIPYGVGGGTTGGFLAGWRNRKATAKVAALESAGREVPGRVRFSANRVVRGFRKASWIGLGMVGAELLNGVINGGDE